MHPDIPTSTTAKNNGYAFRVAVGLFVGVGICLAISFAGEVALTKSVSWCATGSASAMVGKALIVARGRH
jgi:uncharacterized membrane protein YjfL (UPF0719 family)